MSGTGASGRPGSAGATREYQLAEMRRYFPSRVDDPAFEQWHVNHERLAASPGAAAWFLRVLMETDIREVLPTISVPTLLMYRPEWRDACLYMADHIPNVQTVELNAPDVSIYADPQIPHEVERFLAEGRIDTAPERVLTTVLFTDIVDSTSCAAELGDKQWRELLEAHHAAVRAQLARYSGKEMRSTGDGFFATFAGPARAIACAHKTINAVGELGLDIRAGIHTGEVEVIAGRSRASRSTSAPASRRRPSPARCWCRASSATSPPAPGSTSRTAATTPSRASRASGASSPLDSATAPG